MDLTAIEFWAGIAAGVLLVFLLRWLLRPHRQIQVGPVDVLHLATGKYIAYSWGQTNGRELWIADPSFMYPESLDGCRFEFTSGTARDEAEIMAALRQKWGDGPAQTFVLAKSVLRQTRQIVATHWFQVRRRGMTLWTDVLVAHSASGSPPGLYVEMCTGGVVFPFIYDVEFQLIDHAAGSGTVQSGTLLDRTPWP